MTDLIRRDVPMAPMTSWGIGGPAEFFAEPRTPEQVIQCLEFARDNGLQVYVISFGTDVLVSDGKIGGLVISARRLKGISVDGTSVVAGAGEGLARVCMTAADVGLSGLEELYGIPGAMGGSVAKNAGAYGREMAQIVQWAEVITPDGEVMRLTPQDIGFRYRGSRLPELGIIVKVSLALGRGDPEKSRNTMYYYNEKRKRHQPIGQRSAGCVFKNPPEGPAARFIEKAGLKGLRVNDAEVSRVHANFIVNTGNATARDVLKLVGLVKTKVYDAFGVMLEEEIETIPGGLI